MAAGAVPNPPWATNSWSATAWEEDVWGESGGGGTYFGLASDPFGLRPRYNLGGRVPR